MSASVKSRMSVEIGRKINLEPSVIKLRQTFEVLDLPFCAHFGFSVSLDFLEYMGAMTSNVTKMMVFRIFRLNLVSVLNESRSAENISDL